MCLVLEICSNGVQHRERKPLEKVGALTHHLKVLSRPGLMVLIHQVLAGFIRMSQRLLIVNHENSCSTKNVARTFT